MIRNELEESHAALYAALMETETPSQAPAADGSPLDAKAAAAAAAFRSSVNRRDSVPTSKASVPTAAAKASVPTAAAKGSPEADAASSQQPTMDYKAILKAIKEHEDASSKHPWIVAWEKWAKTAPKTGHDEDLPIAEIIISLAAESAVLRLKAQNGAHIGVKHFVEMVGCEVAADIWQKAWWKATWRCKAKKHQVPGMVEGEMELWEMEGDNCQVIFAITPEQFHPTIGVREAVSSFFQSQCMMARLSSLVGKASGSTD